MSIKMRKLKRMRAKRHGTTFHLAYLDFPKVIEALTKAETSLAALVNHGNLEGMQHHLAQREFSGIAELQRHMEKASAFQREIDRALAWKDQSDALTKLELERKRQAFLSLRDENYVASLRLEGFDVASDNVSTTLEALRRKYAR